MSQIGIVQPQATDLAAEELAAEKLQQGYHAMKAELGKVIVGQEAVIEELLIALFCKGHALLVGVPGLAKTPFPEASLNGFMSKFNAGPPPEEENSKTVPPPPAGRTIDLKPVPSGEEVLAPQEPARKAPVADHVTRYALQFPRLTRKTEG